MAVAGLLVTIMSLVVYFALLETVMENAFLCVLLTLAAYIGLGLTAAGYDKSYKNAKRSVHTLKDKWEMMTGCFMTCLIVLFSYHILFRREGLGALIYAFPYVLAGFIIVWLAGSLTISRKMKAVRKIH